jgi:hypothetical protein
LSDEEESEKANENEIDEKDKVRKHKVSIAWWF